MALTYILYMLAQHHDLIRKIYGELLAYGVGELRLVELEKLPTLNAVIHETMRLYPPVPNLGGRVCPGTTIAGYYVPSGVPFPFALG
jgi:cytochrome P450